MEGLEDPPPSRRRLARVDVLEEPGHGELAQHDTPHFAPSSPAPQNMPLTGGMLQGPVTEELLFRSAAVPLLLGAGMSIGRIVFVTPFIFGVAHIHHFYEFRLTHPHVPVFAAVARSLLQLTYTTLFGAYATFVFIRTGSLLSVISVHAFCNSMGLPRLWGHVQPYWSHPGTPSWKWTSLYYVLLVSGSVAWWSQLWPLTASDNALASWEEYIPDRITLRY